MKIALHQWAFRAFVLAALLSLIAVSPQPQESGRRRLLSRAAPAYPELARRMSMQGVGKLDALVAPDGTVEAAEVKGGPPVLAPDAVGAVRRWKWESAHPNPMKLLKLSSLLNKPRQIASNGPPLPQETAPATFYQR
jgi:Gram-negative bacterial TonB protein C-terminal